MGFFSDKLFASRKNYGKLDITLCESPTDVADDVPFRLVTDAENIVRIKQSYPTAGDGRFTCNAQDWQLPVAGVSDRPDAVMSFIAGKSRSIQLVQEARNGYPHPIAVYGVWKGIKGKTHEKQLGYIPDDNVREISDCWKRTPNGIIAGKLSMMFIPYRDKGAGLRIDVAILTHALHRFEVNGFDRENGRERKRTYSVRDLDEAIDKASKDGIVVDVSACKQV